MEITQNYALECFEYNPETGDLRWKPRPQNHYPTMSGWRKATTRFSGKIAGSLDRKGYYRVNLDGTIYRAHRLIWLIVYGVYPLGEVDHINGNPRDNRIENLRVVTQWVNSKNKKMPSHNTSGRIGVAWREDLGKWSAKIGIGKSKSKSLGFFDTKAEAIAARIGAEKVLCYHVNHGR